MLLLYGPELFPFALPAFNLPVPDLDQVRPHPRPTFHAYENAVEQSPFRLREFLLRHNNHILALYI